MSNIFLSIVALFVCAVLYVLCTLRRATYDFIMIVQLMGSACSMLGRAPILVIEAILETIHATLLY